MHSPLLHPNDGAESMYNDERNPVIVHRSPHFSQSPHNNSLTVHSVGQRNIMDAFSLYGRASGIAKSSGDERKFDEGHDCDVHAHTEDTQLAREQQILLSDNSIVYQDYGALAGNRKITMHDAKTEVVETNKVRNEAVTRGIIQTSWRRELIVLCNSSLPLIVSFLLQFSLPIASVFSVGHLGKAELGAVSLATMTCNMTGFAMIQGFASCLDTLCSQAFGAGKFHLVGLYFQKCVALIIGSFIPVAIIWWYSGPILMLFVQDKDVAHMTMVYLRILIFAVPGFTLFECGKKYMQAQGIFHAATLVLLVCAPFNMTMNYILVWNKSIGVGYAGAPLAVLMTAYLMPTMLLLYVRFVDGSRCWGGLSKDIFRNWGPMFKLAIPGFVMVEAEFFAYEVMTASASQIGTTALAAQSVLATITSLTYQVPFAVSSSVATRVANFVGATLEQPAVLASKVGIMSSFIIACSNGLALYFFRQKIGGLFSNDEDVVELVTAAMPICAFLQLFESPSCITGGILRGQGRQHLAGYLNIICYYLIALPIGITLAFSWKLKLFGFWAGLSIGLLCVASGELFFIGRSDWKQIIRVATERNRDERILNVV